MSKAWLQRAVPLAIFAGAALLLLGIFGNRLILATNDEGIYLDAAERIIHGQKPYVDFFGYMSPGSFWMQALAFQLFGMTMTAGRVLVLLYVALEAALVYWIVARFASRSAAVVTALFFLAFQTADPSMLTATHRWDSGAFALGSIAFSLSGRRRWLVASGMLIAWAALATPSVALVAIVTLAWLRRRAGWYLLGIAAAGAGAVLALWLGGILPAFVHQLQWLSRNYSAVNVMPYGAIIGGYRALFQNAGLWELPVRFCVVLCLALPALLPVVALVGRREVLGAAQDGARLLAVLCDRPGGFDLSALRCRTLGLRRGAAVCVGRHCHIRIASVAPARLADCRDCIMGRHICMAGTASWNSAATAHAGR